MGSRVVLASTSAATDGGFTAIADVSRALAEVGAQGEYRLIGGITVLFHIQRLALDLPFRVTGDADFGVPRQLLSRPELAGAIEALGYRKTLGNRWERSLGAGGTATVDLLVPAYTSRPRDTFRVGNVVTTEVPGLATALRRPGISIDAELHLTSGDVIETTVVVPDALATLTLKAKARTVRVDSRDARDLPQCLEIAAADGVTPERVDAEADRDLRTLLERELGAGGASLRIVTADLADDAAARLRTRIRALLAEVIGITDAR